MCAQLLLSGCLMHAPKGAWAFARLPQSRTGAERRFAFIACLYVRACAFLTQEVCFGRAHVGACGCVCCRT